MQEQLGLFTQEVQPQYTVPERPPERPLRIPIYRVTLVRERTLEHYGTLRSSADVSQLLREYLAGLDREHFVVLMVDKKNRVIGMNTVSVGSLDSAIVHPREVYKPAILSNAAALIFGHNHPSGDPAPSPEDRVLTTRLVEAGKLLGMQVLDHIIIGSERSYYSFADADTLHATGETT